jgi:hypothetical protein
VEEEQMGWPKDQDPCAPPNLFVETKGNEYEYGDPSDSSLGTEYEIFDGAARTPYYMKYLKFRPHYIYLGLPSNKPVVVVVEKSNSNSFVLIMTATQDVRLTLVSSSSLKQIDEALKALKFEIKLRDLVRISSDHRSAASVMEQICKFEDSRIVMNYKFGVIYWKDGQGENDAFANQTSPHFDAFLKLIGERIKLRGWSKYRGGLNVKEDETGEESVYAEANGFNMMFHVSTMLPYNAKDTQQLERKRHLGNDVVIIVFRDPGSEPFDVSKMVNQFNHVFIVVSVHGAKGYRVGVATKPGVPFFGPRIPQGGVFAQSADFTNWLHAKLVNAERASMHAKDFKHKLQKTRNAQLTSLIKTQDSKSHHENVPSNKRKMARKAKKMSVVDPNDPKELHRRLNELQSRQKTDLASLEGLKKLSGFYANDEKAKKETETKITELEKEQVDILNQIKTIQGKLKKENSSIINNVVLSNKTDSEKQSMINSFKAEVTQQEKTVTSLRKLLGFYSKDPVGAEQTKSQLQKEEDKLASLKQRIQELEDSMSPAQGEAAAAEEEEEEEEEEKEVFSHNDTASFSSQDDFYYEDEDDFNVDALAGVLKGIDAGGEGNGYDEYDEYDYNNNYGEEEEFNVDALTAALKGAGIDQVEEEEEGGEEAQPTGLEGLKNTLAGLDWSMNESVIEDDGWEEGGGEENAIGVIIQDYCDEQNQLSVSKDQRVWILSEENAEWTYISGPAGDMYVPSSYISVE